MPEQAGTIIFEHKGIGKALMQNRLVVPLNQREYSWLHDHVTDLLTDFSNAIATNKAAYFLGTIVLTSGDSGFPEVADGQQRLATTTILIAAIRDWFHSRGDDIRVTSIENDFLFTIDRETRDKVCRLTLNVDDNEFFQKRILSRPGSPERDVQETKNSHRNIVKAAQLAAEHVKDVLSQHREDTRIPILLQWLKFIEDGAQVILLRVPEDLNAFVMFETLNDRGLKTSQADLLKNHLFRKAGNRIKEAQQKWARMMGILESVSDDDITVTYLHHLLITRYGPTRAREVFDKVKAEIDSQTRSIEFLDAIAESASDYAAILNPNHSKWNEYGEATRRHIETIHNDLRVEQIRPLMFAVAKNFSIKEAKKALRLFVCWSVRFLIVGGRGGLLDRNYSQRAYEAGTGKINTASELARAMNEVVPTDATFEAAFADAHVSQGHLARYYLRALERHVARDPNPELIPNDEQDAINLEHVLPANPEDHWPGIDPEVASVYYRRIGNIVLLKANQNSAIGNQPFSAKRPTLKASAFTLTSMVGDFGSWGLSEINERQRRLAGLAVKTWSIDVR